MLENSQISSSQSNIRPIEKLLDVLQNDSLKDLLKASFTIPFHSCLNITVEAIKLVSDSVTLIASPLCICAKASYLIIQNCKTTDEVTEASTETAISGKEAFTIIEVDF